MLKLVILMVFAHYCSCQIPIPSSSSSSSTTRTTTGGSTSSLGTVSTSAAIVSCQTRYNSDYQLNGTCMPVANCLGATLSEICANVNHVCCINDPDSEIIYPQNELIPFVKYLELVGDTLRNRRLYPLFSRSIQDAGISKCHQAAAYFAQIRADTSDLKFFEESSKLSLNNDSDASIGNNQPGDGLKYRGRGALYLRGRGNYLNATLENSITKYNLLFEPEAAAFPSIAFKLASYIWSRNSYVITENKPARKGSLNILADGTFHNFTLLTHALTSNIQSLKDRSNKYEAHVKALKCTAIKRGRGVACEIGARFGIAVPICLIDYKRPFCGCEGEFQMNSCPYGYSTSGQCRSSSIIKCCVERCQRSLDLAIIIDSSNSITFDQYKKAKSFVRALVSDLEIGESSTRVAIINYSIESEIIANLSSIYDKEALIKTIDSIEHQALAGTNTQLALYQTDKIIFQEENGMRPLTKGIPKVAVIITDGASNILENRTIPNAQALKNRGISIISVGVGDQVNQNELEQMATNVDDVYNIENYEIIYEIIESLSRSICEQSAKALVEEPIVAEVKQFSYTYFQLDLNTTSIDKKFSISLTDLAGSSKLFYSFDEENPKDNADYLPIQATSQSNQNFNENYRAASDKYYQICKETNKTLLFMSVKGFSSNSNQFRIFVYNRSVITAECGSSILNHATKKTQSSIVLLSVLLILTFF